MECVPVVRVVVVNFATAEVSATEPSVVAPSLNVAVPVGVPIPGVDVKLAPDGEVIARGPNIFKGYWENPEATAAAIDSAGWFHTGDLGRFDEDGFLWLHGRKKDMIALPDGLKVYPEDIENVLAADPRIEALATPQRPVLATVVGLERPGETLQVHAVFLEPKERATIEQIVRDANAKLSSSQQIRGWTIWPDDDLPRTPTLKVRKQLMLDRLTELERVAIPAGVGADAAEDLATAGASSPSVPGPAAHAPLARTEPVDNFDHLRELVSEIG